MNKCSFDKFFLSILSLFLFPAEIQPLQPVLRPDMIKQRLPLYGYTILLIWVLTGCSVTRKLESDESLLIRNRIQVEGHVIPAEELAPYLQQTPNGKFLGLFRTGIVLFQWGAKGKETGFKRWLKNKAGRAPVLVDTSLVSASGKQMEMYLANKGYFHSTVRDSVVVNKKKATVIYHVFPSVPYRIRKIRYAVPDTQVAGFVYRDTVRSLLKAGNNYDSYVFDDERSRITSDLINHGFYKFSVNYIKYTIDTNLRSRQLDLTLEIVNDIVPSMISFQTWRLVPHKRYFVNNIFIYQEFDHVNPYRGVYDTVTVMFEPLYKSQRPSAYYFLNHTDFKVRPRTIAQSIFITPGNAYNLNDVNQTYSQLSGLQVFRYINLRFREVPDKENRLLQNSDLLDCHVELSRKEVQSFAITTDGTNSAGALGVQANLGYQNFNIFRGAQTFRLNFSGSLQMQAVDGFSGKAFFNTIEMGANAGLTFPQFLLPIRQERLPKSFKPKTNIIIGYNYQLQQHYNRHISNISFGYSWRQNDQIQHVLNPVEIALVKIFKDNYFDSVLMSQQDNRLKNQYTDHLVAGLKYIFTYSNQVVGQKRDFFYIRSTLETGGNLFYLANSLLGNTRPAEGQFKLFGLPYAQFIRPDLDIRFYDIMRNNSSLVFRFYAGVGIPYGNAGVLPFEKAFFAGGANGMRGWKMYSLGPGSYNNADRSATFNQIGDIQLEANLEYRFPIYGWVRGALFMDAGNIWLWQESADLPGGKFYLDKFPGQIAIDVGFGLRFDFDFFIFRFDPGIPLKVPTYPGDDRWTFDKMQLKDIVWNFGIGYPF